MTSAHRGNDGGSGLDLVPTESATTAELRMPSGHVRLGSTALVHARTDQDDAATRWLLMAADDPGVAVREWDRYGVALMRCGTLFSAIRMDGPLVWAAAGTDDLDKAAEHLAGCLRGPVFMDSYPHRYYALVPANTVEHSEWVIRERAQQADAQLLGDANFLGVPRPSVREYVPGRRCWWVLPYERDGDLCSAEAVGQLIRVGRYRRAHVKTGAGS